MRPRTAAALALLVSSATAVAFGIALVRGLLATLGSSSTGPLVILATSLVGVLAGAVGASHSELRRARRWARLGELELVVGLLLWVAYPAMRALLPALAAAGTEGPVLVGAALLWLPISLAAGARLSLLAAAVDAAPGEGAREAAFQLAVPMLALGGAFGSCVWMLWTLPGFDLGGSLAASGSVQIATGLAIRTRLGSTAARPACSGPGSSVSSLPSVRREAWVCFGSTAFVTTGYVLVVQAPIGIISHAASPSLLAAVCLGLLGIALGSLLVARGRFAGPALRDPAWSFAALQVALGVCLAVTLAWLPDLAFFHAQLLGSEGGGFATLRAALSFAPVVFLPGLIQGAAFALAVRVLWPAGISAGMSAGMPAGQSAGPVEGRVGVGPNRASRSGWLGSLVAVGAGVALAGGIVGFGQRSGLGLDVTLFVVILCNTAAAALLLLTAETRKPTPPAVPSGVSGVSGAQVSPGRRQGLGLTGAALGLLLVSLGYGGVAIEPTTAGAFARAGSLTEHRAKRDSALRQQLLLIQEPGGVVSVAETPHGRVLQTQGLPAEATRLAPPYLSASDFWLGVAPYLLASHPERALLLDLAGGSAVVALLETSLPSIEVADPRPELAEAVALLHEGRANPLSNPRVSLQAMPAQLALRQRRAQGTRVDVVASAPRHSWRVEQASRLTPEFFDVARASLREGGVFASALPAHRMGADTALSVIADFEARLPGGLLLDVSEFADRSALLLLGATAPLRVDMGELRRRLAEPNMARALARYGVESAEDLLARIEGTTAGFAALAPASTGDALLRIELAAALAPRDSRLAFGKLASSTVSPLAADPAAPGQLLPPLVGEPRWSELARIVARRGQADKLARLFADPRTRLSDLDRGVAESLLVLSDPSLGAAPSPSRAESLASGGASREAAALGRLEQLAVAHPQDVSALRVMALHLASRRGRFEPAARLFGKAFERSGSGQDAFDAARAWDQVDASRALAWAKRIPEEERSGFPRVSLFEARAALAAGRSGSELEPLLEALTKYRRSAEGRRLPGVAGVLSELAEATGRPQLAAIHAEADRSERSRRLGPLLAGVRTSVAAADFEAAARGLSQAGRLAPGDAELIEMQARLSAAMGDQDGAARALALLRIHAASPEQAIEQENALRRELALPLLPLFAVEEILGAGA